MGGVSQEEVEPSQKSPGPARLKGESKAGGDQERPEQWRGSHAVGK